MYIRNLEIFAARLKSNIQMEHPTKLSHINGFSFTRGL